MKFYSIVIIVLLSASCTRQPAPVVRPHQYPRVNIPTNQSKKRVHPPECPFTLVLPEYVTLKKRRYNEDQRLFHPCWFNIVMPDLEATLHCTYYPISAESSLEKLIEDAFTMASKHNIKANYRDEVEVTTAQGARGLIFRIHGPVATPYQFYLSDQSNHFLRGSLYFDQKVNIDSIAPIVEFLSDEIDAVVGSVLWE